MINQEQNIPCPVCNTKIAFVATQLMQGMRFHCPNELCDASIGIAIESKPVVEEAMDKLNEIKGKVGKN